MGIKSLHKNNVSCTFIFLNVYLLKNAKTNIFLKKSSVNGDCLKIPVCEIKRTIDLVTDPWFMLESKYSVIHLSIAYDLNSKLIIIKDNENHL